MKEVGVVVVGLAILVTISRGSQAPKHLNVFHNNGDGDFSAFNQATTRYRRQAGGRPLPTPTNLQATPDGSSAINVQWQYNNAIDGVEFLVSVYNKGSLIQDRATSQTSVHLVGLAPETKYDIKVRAFKPLPRGRRANSPYTNAVSAITVGQQLPAPTNIVITSVTDSSIDVQWQYSNAIDGVEFLISVYNKGSLVQDRATTMTSVHLVGLAPVTKYDIRVRAFKPLPGGRRTNSPITDVSASTTAGQQLPVPTNVVITSVMDSSIDVQWQYNNAVDGVEFLVLVYYEGSLVQDRVTSQTSVRLAGLAPDTKYSIKVRAFKPLPGGLRANSLDTIAVSATTSSFASPAQPTLPHPPPETPAPRPPSPQPPRPQPVLPNTTPFVPHIPGDDMCSIEAGQGVDVSVLSCSLGIHSRASECGRGSRVPSQTVVLVDCWGAATMLLQCQGDSLWHPYGNYGNLDGPIRRLCQFHRVNSPVCGIRAVRGSPQGILDYRRQPRFPWLAGIFLKEKYSCTATILSAMYLITAAHCLTRSQVSSSTVDLRDIRVQLLGADGSVHRQFVSRVELYPGYTGGIRPSGDVALIRLDNHLTFSTHLHPACLSTIPLSHLSTAATFHRNHSEFEWDLVIQQTDIRCDSLSHPCSSTLTLHQYQFCTIDVEERTFLDVGSSGGPYLVNQRSDSQERWEVLGVVSSSHSHTHCPQPLTIFNAIYPYTDWVSKCINDGHC